MKNVSNWWQYMWKHMVYACNFREDTDNKHIYNHLLARLDLSLFLLDESVMRSIR